MKVGTRLTGRTPQEDSGLGEASGEDRVRYFQLVGDEPQPVSLPLTIAAGHTEKVGLRTSIALAFARSPMDVAYIGWDLQTLSGGRFTLGAWEPGAGPHRAQIRDGLVRSRAEDARVHPGTAPRLECLADADAREVPRRPLRLQPDAAVLQSRTDRASGRKSIYLSGKPVHAARRGRGGGRCALAWLLYSEVHEGCHHTQSEDRRG